MEGFRLAAGLGALVLLATSLTAWFLLRDEHLEAERADIGPSCDRGQARPKSRATR